MVPEDAQPCRKSWYCREIAPSWTKDEGGFMRRFIRGVCLSAVVITIWTGQAHGQAPKPLTWEEVKARFEANNPTLRAGEIGIDESKANEITAYLRPNPTLTLAQDGTQIAPHDGVW